MRYANGHMSISVNKKNVINRVYRHGHHVRDTCDFDANVSYQNDYNNRCNNCGRSYWPNGEHEDYPRYCWICRSTAIAFEQKHSIDYWDDEEIPF